MSRESSFDTCDDFILTLIIDKIGRDSITLRNLRATCRRWRSLITLAPNGRDDELYWAIYRALKNESSYDQTIAPMLRRIINNANYAHIYALLLRNRKHLLKRSMDAKTSHIFRDIWSRLWNPGERHVMNIYAFERVLRWNDAEEICNMFIQDYGISPISITECAHESIEQFRADKHKRIINIVTDITNSKLTPEQNERYHPRLFYLIRSAIIRRIFIECEEMRACLTIAHYEIIADLISARDIARCFDTIPDHYKYIAVIFDAYGSNRIPHDIINVLLERVNPNQWEYIFADYPINKFDPHLRHGLETLFGQPIAVTAAQHIFIVANPEELPRWKCIKAVREANHTLLNDAQIFTALMNIIHSSYSRARYVIHRIVMTMVKMHFDFEIIVRFMARTKTSAQSRRRILRGIVNESARIKGARQYARAFANREIRRKCPQMTHRSHQSIFEHSLWRELYNDFGYIDFI